ncbi:MAG TPA: TatD family hydrolase [bacterium]|nr:TatD family hydrolase [bacterium]
MPLERLVLETDGPWLAPQAWRGKRNEPAYMVSVAAQLAQIKGVDLETVAAATTANATRLYKLEGKA